MARAATFAVLAASWRIIASMMESDLALTVAVLSLLGGISACAPTMTDGPRPPSSGSSTAAVAETGSATAASPPVPRAPAATPGTWPLGPAPSAEEERAQLERLQNDPGPLRTNWTPPGRTERYGHAEAKIASPYEAVRARLADFAHYKDLAGPKFKKVTVVDRQPGSTDIYFQLPIMKGMMTIWYVGRFVPPRPAAGAGEVVEGVFVKGNIRDMHLVLAARPGPDAASAVLVCDLLLVLDLPAPQADIDQALRDACGDALRAVRRLTAPPPAAGP